VIVPELLIQDELPASVATGFQFNLRDDLSLLSSHAVFIAKLHGGADLARNHKQVAKA